MTIPDILAMVKAYILDGDTFAQQQLSDILRDSGDEVGATQIAAQRSIYAVVGVDVLADDFNACIQRFVISGPHVEELLRDRLGDEAEFFDSCQDADLYLMSLAADDDDICGAEPPWDDEDDGTGDYDDNNPYEDY